MTYDPQAYPPAQPTGAYPQPGAPTGWNTPTPQPGYAPAYAPAQPRPNPLATMPISDWVRDGAALVLLLVSLALPWSLRFSFGMGSDSVTAAGATRIEVILITVLSVLSLAVTYLARFGALGAGMTTGRTAALRAALNAPYALLILTYVVLDATKVGDLGTALGTGVGLGAGAALGLTGALLAATPRAHEVGTADARWPIVRAGYAAAAVLFGVIALTALLGVILLAVSMSGISAAYSQYNQLTQGLGGSPAPAGLLIASAFAVVLLLDAALLVPAVLVLRRSPSAARIAGAIGIAVLVATVIAAFTGFSIGTAVSSLYQGGYPLMWLATYAAVMTSPALLAGMRPQAALTTWFVAARQSLVAIVVVSGILAVLAVVALIAGGGNGVGFLIGIILCQVLSAVGALIARIQLVSAPERARTVTISVAGGIAALQIVALILAAVSSRTSTATGYFSVMPVTYLIVVGLPALVVYALTVPRDVRAYFTAHAPARPAAAYPQPGFAQAAYGQQPAQPGYGQQPAAYGQPPAYAPPVAEPPAYAPPVAEPPAYAPPVAEPPAYAPAPPAAPPVPPAPAAPAVREEARRAADPGTPADELYGYTSDPTLWPALAANPALYPELVSWLAATGDPEVIAALRARGAL